MTEESPLHLRQTSSNNTLRVTDAVGSQIKACVSGGRGFIGVAPLLKVVLLQMGKLPNYSNLTLDSYE